MLANRAIETTRETCPRPVAVELGPDGLVAAMRELIGQVQKLSGVRFEMQMDGSVRVEITRQPCICIESPRSQSRTRLRHSGASEIVVGLRT